jgi:hypothetical protein
MPLLRSLRTSAFGSTKIPLLTELTTDEPDRRRIKEAQESVESRGTMFDQFKRLVFLPVLVSNLYSMVGVLFLNWSVADVFFWFWCEFVLTGLTMIVLTVFWSRADKSLLPGPAKLSPFLASFSFLVVLTYASMFSGLAYKGEWKSWDRFPELLADKTVGLLAIIVVGGIYFGTTLRKPNYGLEEARNVEQQFARRSFAILGLYAVLMFHYHWTGAHHLNLSPAYLKAMGMLLLTFKLIAEFGVLDRLFKRLPKQSRTRARQNS